MNCDKPRENLVAAELKRRAGAQNLDVFDEDFAALLDDEDELRSFREKFAYPRKETLPEIGQNLPAEELAEECIYLCGNSLGLKPKSADAHMQAQLQKWADMGVYMHFEEPLPAATCDRYGREALGRIVGAEPSSVTLMNGLTVNLHLLLCSFYQPAGDRYKILIEGGAFPSDRYAMLSQIELRGYDPEEALIQIQPRAGEDLIRIEDIMEILKEEGPSIAVVCLSGVQYYTGQKFDMERITWAAHAEGCVVGWDLAHAVGNVEIRLDEWGVDFACWCTYKYLNSGPGCIAGAYVNKKHAGRSSKSQLRGWWSNKEDTRFLMQEHCDVAPGVDGFRLCNPPPFLVALVIASLEIFDEAGMEKIIRKQRLLTGYLEHLLLTYFNTESSSNSKPFARIITPDDPAQRGCQLSLSFSLPIGRVHAELGKRGIVCDVRQPNVMRIAPAPLYNSYSDVHKFVTSLKDVFDKLAAETPLREG
ncbi:kynureninase-like [Hyalella azteca]|uniref:Kynureninase n=1 Tax=Hyalella azteca TaxID=294128 RepID=A0A8B7P4I4_HYAAZ|nr:kynureninase-like [Hyalella azteca]